MAAADHLQNHQLSMFIPARELMDYTAGETENGNLGGEGYLPLSQSPNVRSRKLRDSKEHPGNYAGYRKQSLYDSIKQKGVSTPVELKLPRKNGLSPNIQIWDGNHRVVAAHDIDPNMEVPVRYS